MFGIALRFGLSLEALKTANPSVNPYAMGQYTTLVLPLTATPAANPGTPTPSHPAAIAPPTYTPTPESAYPLFAYRDAAGGLQVFVIMANTTEKAMENPSAMVTLQSKDGSYQTQMTAILPLNILPAHTTLPLAAYFPAPIPDTFLLNVQADFALPVPENDQRYRKVSLSNQIFRLSEDKKSAQVEASASFAGQTVRAATALAIAYGKEGQVLGYRQMDLAKPIHDAYPILITVYSLESQIESVKLYVEAKAPWK